MSDQSFAIFILTHGRANNVKTYKTLRSQGYTGDIYILIDNKDKQGDEYKKLYGDKVIVFDKDKYKPLVDSGDNIPKDNSVVYARNACFDEAERLGIEWFIQMDDDYTIFQFMFDKEKRFAHQKIKNLDRVFSLVFDYFRSIPASSIAFGQTGDFMGGGNGQSAQTIRTKRKVMNVFFLGTSRRFSFVGKLNDDVNTYVSHGHKGILFFSALQLCILQTPTQSQTGGLSDIYAENGTYVKSFNSVMHVPSAVKVSVLGAVDPRIHHFIDYKRCVPMIIPERYRKSVDRS